MMRRGEEIARPPRPVTFYTLDLCAWQPPVATVLIDCSKGTYIRALARDLLRRLDPLLRVLDGVLRDALAGVRMLVQPQRRVVAGIALDQRRRLAR